MSQWPVIDSTGPDIAVLIQIKLGLLAVPDGITAATPLDIVKFRGSQTIDEVWLPKYGFNSLAGVGWGWISVAFLLGGLYLLKNRVIQYHAPASLLLTLTLLSIFFYDSGSSDSLGSPLLHLFSCSTMFAAFFIVTDPVSSPSGAAGQIIFGAGVGIITFIIRTAGAYPEGIAFAILLMNAAAPLIDRLRLAPPALSSLSGRGKSE
jgi:electron transport complex protein RnfD